MIIAVAEFNKKRNNLHINMELEVAMLHEEIREFWDAKTTAERLDALVDTKYVWDGTRIKASYHGVGIETSMYKWIEDSTSLMYDYLQEELGDNFHTCYRYATKIVCDANAIKGNKLDENGKVLKDDDYNRKIDATAQIAEMLELETKPKGY